MSEEKIENKIDEPKEESKEEIKGENKEDVKQEVIEDTPKKKDITKVLTSDEMPQFVKEATVKPKKNIKRILIFAVAAIVLIGMATYFIVRYLNSKESKGAKSAGKIAYVYMDIFNENTDESFTNYVSNDCPNKTAFINSIESGMQLNKAYIYQLDEGSASVVVGDSYASADRKKKLTEFGYKKNKAEDMKDITLSTDYIDIHGTSNAGNVSFVFTVMRASGVWYLVDIKQGDVVNYSAPAASFTDASSTDATVGDASATDALPLDANGLKNSLFSKEIIFDGKKYSLPFDYSKISKDYTFEMEDYGYDDEYSLNPGDLITGTIALSSKDMEDDVSLWIGFTNETDDTLEIKKCQVNSLRMDIRWATKDKYPDFILPGEITFGSSIDDLIAAYGKPTSEPYRAEEMGYWSYTYSSPNHDYNVEFVITDDMGITEISVRTY